ncbi:MAG: substrate-binding domain-containing protein [Halomonas sp.]|nr:substrate-binding domain-containing protein [Halomonas sp.]
MHEAKFASYSDPPLTTIAQPAEAFGHEAVARLIEVMEGKAATSSRTLLPHKLVFRDSTARFGSA